VEPELDPSGQLITDYVVLLLLMREADDGLRPVELSGTGFLIADGRGLIITAAHVARRLEGHETAVGIALFNQIGAGWTPMPIRLSEQHPVEDVALLRIDEYEYYSPFTIAADEHYASGRYELWGYPDDVYHDRMASAGAPAPDLIYSSGHVRRRISYDLPAISGRSFYELSSPAGSCCSGAPVTISREPQNPNPWRVAAIYVGERRNYENTLAVGYATRTEAIVDHWPELLLGGGHLASLCQLPSASN
jgi:hypothetical protein